jgi:hypothetical protein
VSLALGRTGARSGDGEMPLIIDQSTASSPKRGRGLLVSIVVFLLILLGLLLGPLFHSVHIRLGNSELFAQSFWESDVIYEAGYHDYHHWFYKWRTREIVVKVPIGTDWVYRVEYRTPK